MGKTWDFLVSDPQLRWIGPEKGVISIATGAVSNAIWDLYARARGKPLWKLIVDFTPVGRLAFSGHCRRDLVLSLTRVPLSTWFRFRPAGGVCQVDLLPVSDRRPGASVRLVRLSWPDLASPPPPPAISPMPSPPTRLSPSSRPRRPARRSARPMSSRRDTRRECPSSTFPSAAPPLPIFRR